MKCVKADKEAFTVYALVMNHQSSLALFVKNEDLSETYVGRYRAQFWDINR